MLIIQNSMFSLLKNNCSSAEVVSSKKYLSLDFLQNVSKRQALFPLKVNQVEANSSFITKGITVLLIY